MFDSILLVCEANLCRSPMAQAILARKLPGTRVSSAGTRAIPGHPADEVAAKLMLEHGYDLGSHLTNLLDLEHMRNARLVLTMTMAQRKAVESTYPFARGRVYRLGEHGGFDVRDPYLWPRAVYEETLAQIELGLGNWIQGIRQCG